MRLVLCLMLLVCVIPDTLAGWKGWRSAIKYGRRKSHGNQKAIAPAPNPASGGTNPQPALQVPAPGQDNKPSIVRNLAATGSKIAVESAVASLIGVGINKAFSGGGESVPPAAPAAAAPVSAPASPSAVTPAAAPAPPTPVKSALPSATGQQDGTTPAAATGSDAAQTAVEEPRVEARTSASDAARRVRVRSAVMSSIRSSACSTSPLMAAVSTALLLSLTFAVVG